MTASATDFLLAAVALGLSGVAAAVVAFRLPSPTTKAGAR